VLRNKVRTALTIGGVAVTIIGFLMLRTFIYAWTVAADYAARDRIVTRNKITFVMTLPKRYAEDVRNTEGVKGATFANWFGGKDPNHETEFFGTLAADTQTFFVVYDEMKVPPDQLATWKQNRRGLIAGDVIAQKLGWKLGDKVTLDSSIYPVPPDEPWSFTVDGIYTATSKSVDRSTVIFHWDYLNERLTGAQRDQIGWIISRIHDPGQSAAISTKLDRMFEERELQTLSQDERAFQTSFLASVSAVLAAIDIVSIVILVFMMLILGNTIAMGVRERTSEYGTLRAIGFTPRHIVGFILTEAIVIGVLGGALGLGLAYPLVQEGLGRFLEENVGAFFPYFRIEPRTAGVAFGLACALALLAAVLPALGASRLKVTEALRRVA
jgi:putative ABC transport system permease protein